MKTICKALIPQGVLKRVRLSGLVPEKCMGCGVCINACPEDALSLVAAAARGGLFENFEIHRLPVTCGQAEGNGSGTVLKRSD